MTKKVLNTLIIIGLTVLIMVVVYFKDVIGAVLIHSERIGAEELSAMIRSKTNPLEGIKKNIDGKEYFIPLPRYTAFYKRKSNLDGLPISYYLTSSQEDADWNVYVNEVLPRYGWEKHDQFGAGVIIQRINSDVKTDFVFQRFTHFYDMISFLD